MDKSIVLGGEAGQGLVTVEKILTKIIQAAGFHVFSTQEAMSRIRGGYNTTSIRVSDQPVSAYVERIDLFVPLADGETKHLRQRISSQTKVLPRPQGNYANTAAVGAICGALKIDKAAINQVLTEIFKNKGEDVVRANLAAMEQGYSGVQEKFDLLPDKNMSGRVLINGAEAVGMGALAGGCNFISAYPMSPSTGVLVYLASQKEIIVEQAEDEISAMNMGLGAWYAGGRALVSTSGGGFDLMQEGLSLAGMTETPLVIHLAQRPGPATGLPTRTEQADLNLALYSGHGEFPRIILAPGDLAQAFYLTQKAFDLADKHQCPVFVLTDQYLIDSYYDLDSSLLPREPVNHHLVKADKNYQRYLITDSGVSPRAVPGQGEGLVHADSDEHNEEGYITEDLELRVKMVDKRLSKAKGILADAFQPTFIGGQNYETLVIGWGSTKEIIREALAKLDNPKIAFLHFGQVYPVPPEATAYFKKAKKILVIENNAVGQFADLLEKALGIKISQRILKYNGLPFSVEEVMERLKNG